MPRVRDADPFEIGRWSHDLLVCEVSALVWLAFASLFALSLLDNIRGPFYYEILRDMNLDATWGSAFFAVTSLFAVVGSWGSHWIVKRKSGQYLLALASFGLGLGFVVIALNHKFTPWIVGCAIFGLAYGALNLAQNLLVFQAGSAALRRRIYSGLHSMYGLSALIAPFVATFFRHIGLTWRQGFFLLALLPLIVGGISRFVGTRSRRGPDLAPHMQWSEWRHCMLFAAMMAGYLWGEISVSTRLVLWLRSDLGWSADTADLFLAGFFLTLLAGRVVLSFVNFKQVSNWMILWMSAGASTLLYFLALRFSPVWILPLGLTMSVFFPIAMDQVSELFQGKSAQALGFVLGFGSLSIVVMHTLLGYCTDRWGIGQALMVGPSALFVIFMGLSGLLWRAGRLAKLAPLLR